MNKIILTFITLFCQYTLTIAQDITIDYCGGKNNATLTSIGNLEDRYEWYVEVGDSLKKIGNTQIINVPHSYFNKNIICKRYCVCEADYTYQTRVPFREKLVAMDIITHPVSCHSLNDGKVKLNIKNEQGVHTFLWSDGQTSRVRNDLAAGQYTVTVTNEIGCMEAFKVNIEAPNRISLNIKKQTTTCSNNPDGVIELLPTEKESKYSYSWNNGAHSNKITNLKAGKYTVTVSDLDACEIKTVEIKNGIGIQAVVKIPTPFNGFSVPCSNSSDATIEVNIHKGKAPYTILWNEKTIEKDFSKKRKTIEHLTSGQHSLKVVDALGCIFVKKLHIKAPKAIQPTIKVSNYNGYGVQCKHDNNGSIAVIAHGGSGDYIFKWSKNDSLLHSSTSNLVNLNKGKYHLQIYDSNGCSYDTSIVINEPHTLRIKRQVVKLGSKGKIEITPYGGVGNYKINGVYSNKTVIKDKLPIRQSVLIEDGNGCLIERKLFAKNKRQHSILKRIILLFQNLIPNLKIPKKKKKLKRNRCPVW